MAAALQSNEQFKNTMQDSLMYHAHLFGNSDINNASAMLLKASDILTGSYMHLFNKKPLQSNLERLFDCLLE